MNLNSSQQDGVVTLNVEGDLTIQYANDIKAKFVETIENSKQLVLTHQNISVIDLSYVQLLNAVSKTARQKDIKLVIKNDLQGILKKSTCNAGFKNLEIIELQEG